METKSKIINDIVKKFKVASFSKVLILVGSAIKKKTVKNVDILLITSRNIYDKDIFKIVDKEYFIGKYNDCYTFNIKNILFNITAVSIKDFDIYFNKTLKQKELEPSYRNWCLGYFIPEAFLGDLKDSKVIFQKIDFIKKYKDKLIKYPKTLKIKIIKSSLNDLEIKERLFNKAFKKNDFILTVTAISDIFFISFRALSAKKETYFKGLFNYREVLENYSKLRLLIEKIKKNISKNKELNILIKNYLKETRKLLK